ncbi:hypothetical protein P5673_002084 [Acropora cervicornis]|uniref:Uncharacterized protein n=1 Tax=Acropora cervicornis TaxID=6130 RepID=A0AAD9R561_ACRCE|nr:hypothetical protein P5673_002084 [Acropora cervicornis]
MTKNNYVTNEELVNRDKVAVQKRSGKNIHLLYFADVLWFCDFFREKINYWSKAMHDNANVDELPFEWSSNT